MLCASFCNRRNLQEEVDELRVQASTDAATQHELRVQLQAQQEGEVSL